jgi:hypothetical protein
VVPITRRARGLFSSSAVASGEPTRAAAQPANTAAQDVKVKQLRASLTYLPFASVPQPTLVPAPEPVAPLPSTAEAARATGSGEYSYWRCCTGDQHVHNVAQTCERWWTKCSKRLKVGCG